MLSMDLGRRLKTLRVKPSPEIIQIQGGSKDDIGRGILGCLISL
jgi:hypothetical protein